MPDNNIDEKINKELDELDQLLDKEISDNHLEKNQIEQKTEINTNGSNQKNNTYVSEQPEKQENKTENPEFNTVESYLNQGKKFFLKHKFSEAAEQFQKVLDIDSNNIKAIFNLAIIYLYRNETQLAKKNFEKILEIKPDDYKTICNLAGIYHDNGDYKKAYDMLEKAVAINPNDINSLENLSLIEKKLMYLNQKK